MSNDAIRDMMAAGVPTAEAHIMHDLTKLATEEATQLMMRIADRAPENAQMLIFIGALGSIAGLLKSVAPEVFAAVAATDIKVGVTQSMTMRMGKLNLD